MSVRRIAIVAALLVGVLAVGTVYAANFLIPDGGPHTIQCENPSSSMTQPTRTGPGAFGGISCLTATPPPVATNTPTPTNTPLPPTATPTPGAGGTCNNDGRTSIALIGNQSNGKDSGDCILSQGEGIPISCNVGFDSGTGDFTSAANNFREVWCDSGSNNDHASFQCSPTSPVPVRTIVNTNNWFIGCGNFATATATNTPSAPTPTPTNTPVGPTATPTAIPPTPTPGGGGNVVLITSGTGYSNTNPTANTIYRCAPGVILDGQNSQAWAFTGSNNNVTIENCIIQNYASCFNCGAIYSEGTWLIQNNEIRNNRHGGVDAGGDNTRVIGNNVHHNGQYGIAGGESSGLLIENNDIHWNNNTCHNGEEGCIGDAQGGTHHDARFEAGGGKVTVASNTIWRNNRVSHNSGVGLWCDESCSNTLYEGNTIWNNGWGGIWHEISYRADIIGNTITNNGTCPANVGCDPRQDAGFWRMEVMIFNGGLQGQTSNMRDNIISGPNTHLVLFNQDRDAFRTWNWWIRDNGLTASEYEFACDDISNCAAVQNTVVFED